MKVNNAKVWLMRDNPIHECSFFGLMRIQSFRDPASICRLSEERLSLRKVRFLPQAGIVDCDDCARRQAGANSIECLNVQSEIVCCVKEHEVHKSMIDVAWIEIRLGFVDKGEPAIERQLMCGPP